MLLAERKTFDDLKLSFSCPSSKKRICLSCGERKTWVLPCHWQMMTYVRQIIVRAWKIDFLASVQNFVVWHKSESEKVYLWSKLKKPSLFDAHLEIPSKSFINIAQGPGAEWTAEWRQLRSIIVKTRNAIYISRVTSPPTSTMFCTPGTLKQVQKWAYLPLFLLLNSGLKDFQRRKLLGILER